MNSIDRERVIGGYGLGDRDVLLPSVDLGAVLRDAWDKVLRRRYLLAASVIAATALALEHVQSATPLYTANGSLLIDPRIGQTPDTGGQTAPAIILSDALTVDSQLRVLTSREVTGSAAEAMGLFATTPATSQPSIVRRIIDRLPFGGGDDLAVENLPADLREQRRREAVRRNFVRNLRVERAGDSFVIDISYTSPGIAFAADAVNLLMQRYLAISGEQQTAATEQTRAWLSDRVDDLGAEVQQAERAVADYRQKNALLAPEGQPAAE